MEEHSTPLDLKSPDEEIALLYYQIDEQTYQSHLDKMKQAQELRIHSVYALNFKMPREMGLPIMQMPVKLVERLPTDATKHTLVVSMLHPSGEPMPEHLTMAMDPEGNVLMQISEDDRPVHIGVGYFMDEEYAIWRTNGVDARAAESPGSGG